MRPVADGRYAVWVSVVSMTGYGAASEAWTPEGRGRVRVDVEVRSVNGRFLEVKIRQPFGAVAERLLRGVAERHAGRGRVELSVFVRRDKDVTDEDALAGVGLDASKVRTVAAAAARAHAVAAEAGLEVLMPNALELLRFSVGLKGGAGDDALAAPPFLEALADTALSELAAFRRTEGQALEAVLRELADQLEACATTLAEQLPGEATRIEARITTRLADLTARASVPQLDPARVAQEVAAVIARGDVDEELARIGSHLDQMRSTLDAQPSVGQGKTLDFVTQELLREFTTMGSKLTSHEGSRVVIEAKAIIERIREQVQNVE